MHLGKASKQVIITKMQNRVDEKVNQQLYAYQSAVSTRATILQVTDDLTKTLAQDKFMKYIQNTCRFYVFVI